MQIKSSEPDLETLFNRINRGSIDLQPDFQRDLVWNKIRKQGLIDTIIREWRFPPVFVVAPKSGGVLDVLDGQQRLNAIFEFFNDIFPINGSIEPIDQEILPLDGLYYSEIPADIARKINSYPVQFFELYDYNEDEPYELFFRLNQGSNLTPAEKRNTLYGPIRAQVRELVILMDDHLINIDKIGFNSSRLSYHDVMSRFIYLLENRGQIKKKVTDQLLIEFYRSGKPVSEKTYRIAEDTIINLARVIKEKIKLNKSTLLTWLLLISSEDVEPGLINTFESIRFEARNKVNSNDPLSVLMSIYQEKSSSSVNDAIPVQLRLLIAHIFIHYLGSKAKSNTSEIAIIIRDKFCKSNDYSEQTLLDLMSSEGWKF